MYCSCFHRTFPWGSARDAGIFRTPCLLQFYAGVWCMDFRFATRRQFSVRIGVQQVFDGRDPAHVARCASV